MSARRAIIGFKGIALAPITTNSVTAYLTEAGVGVPFAGQMNRTIKETKTDIYYDDDLYAQLRNVVGEDVELRMAEVPLSMLETLGLGTYNVTEETLEANFNIVNKYFACRFILGTVDELPFYLNYRVFELTGIRFDNFVTKKESPSVCEVIISGVFKKPQLATAGPYSITQLKEDKSNLAFCSALLAMAEQLPLVPYAITYAAGTGTGSQTAGTAYAGRPFTLPVCTFVPPEGKVFDVWLIAAAEHAPGEAVVFTANTEVTAQWVDEA